NPSRLKRFMLWCAPLNLKFMYRSKIREFPPLPTNKPITRGNSLFFGDTDVHEAVFDLHRKHRKAIFVGVKTLARLQGEGPLVKRARHFRLSILRPDQATG